MLHLIFVFLNDLRHAARGLAKTPAYALTCILVLALGIGANVAIFSIISSVVLRNLPYPDPSRLVFVWERFPTFSDPLFNRIRAARKNYDEWKRQNSVFSSMAAFQGASQNEIVNGETKTVSVGFGAADLFPMLGVQTRLGRLFGPNEEHPGKDLVAVLSDDYFERRFHRSPTALGASLRIGDSAYTVIGVLPPKFHLPATNEGTEQPKADVWVPLTRFCKTSADDTVRQLFVVARLKPGVSLAQARTEMNAIAQRLGKTYKDMDDGWTTNIFPFSVEDTSPTLHRALFVLMAAVAFLLLIACANLANLTLVRASLRSREMAIRLALGANRARVVALSLAESLLISATGAVLGLILAQWCITLILALKPPDIQRPEMIELNGTVLVFAAVIALLTTVIFGLAPAITASQSDIQGALRAAGGRGVSTGRVRARQMLIAAEVALALVLLTGASLMIRSFQKMLATGIGFQTAHLVIADVELPAKRYPDGPGQSRFFSALLDRTRALPGVTAVALTDNVPLHSVSANNFFIAGRPDPPLNALPIADYANVTPNYLPLLGMPLLIGRPFTQTDLETTERAEADPNGGDGVCIVNQAFAQEFFKTESPIGQRLLEEDKKHGCRIVGVVANYRPMGVENGVRTERFFPSLRHAKGTLVIRSTASTESIASAIRKTVYEQDRELTVDTIASLDHYVDEWQSQRRFNTLLLSIFAGLALILALVGIYSVLSNIVASRVREIGIRMAIGAQPLQIGRLVLGQSMTPVLIGLTFGLAGSLILARFLEILLYQVHARDPLTLASAIVVILVITPAAIYMPLRRALAVDCMVALREE
ncbi:MAG TPA: ABC transporter permease [Bryobacteraceae bacterium]|nr:ABC transporter permease [Bryobacteraceae bacterium]